MEAENTTQIYQREVLESFRSLLEEYSITTSSVLYYGSEGGGLSFAVRLSRPASIPGERRKRRNIS